MTPLSASNGLKKIGNNTISKKVHPLKRFFWFCAGASKEVLMESATDHEKYLSMGGAVFATAVFAFASASYAMSFVFSGAKYETAISLLFGLIWGFTILNLDRYLILSIKKRSKSMKQAWMALSRICLAVIIGIVISKPLELKIFEKEISDGIKKYYTQKAREGLLENNKTFEIENKTIIDAYSTKKRELDSIKAKMLIDEKDIYKEGKGMAGIGFTAIPGAGEMYRKRVDELEKLRKTSVKVDTLVNILKDRIDSLEILFNAKNPQNTKDKYIDSLASNAGFFLRYKMLNAISGGSLFDLLLKNEDPFVSEHKNTDSLRQKNNDNTEEVLFKEFSGQHDHTAFFISVLFIIIECLPIIVKLMGGTGAYDAVFDEHEKRVIFTQIQKTNTIRHEVLYAAKSKREISARAMEQLTRQETQREDLADDYSSILN